MTLSTAFAGCTLLPEEGSAEQGAITKRVVATISEATTESGRFEEVVKTSLEYTYQGAPVDPSELTASYLDEDGDDRTVRLSTLTSKTQLREGDVIKVSGANFTSGLVVKRGNRVLADRGGVDADWMRADGVPLPFASTEPGKVAFRLAGEAGFKGSGREFEMGDVYVRSFSASLQMELDADLDVTTSRSASGPRLDVNLDAVPKMDVNVEASITNETGTFDIGVETQDLEGRMEALTMVQLDDAFNVRRTGSSSSAFFDGRIHVWDQDHPKSANYEPEDVEHPMLDERQEYTEEEVRPSGDAPPAWLVRFVERIWAMEVAVGDDYRLHAEVDFGDANFLLDYVVQITAEEDRQVAGSVFPSYRVSQSTEFTVDREETSPTTFDLIHATYWVARDTHLPVYVQSSFTRSFTSAEVEAVLRGLGSEAPFELPQDVVLSLSGEQSIQLVSHSGDLRQAAILGILAFDPSTLAVAGAASMVGSLGALSDSSAEISVPQEPPVRIGFAADESADKLLVNVVGPGADWGRLSAEVDQCAQGGGATSENVVINLGTTSPYQNDLATTAGADLNFAQPGLACGRPLPVYVSETSVPIVVGDALSFCAGPVTALPGPTDVRVRLVDVWNGQVVFEHVFVDVATCAA